MRTTTLHFNMDTVFSDSLPVLTKPPEENQTPGMLRFFNVAHPSELKDKDEMRQNRKHVMQNWLDKERLNPSSKDSRVKGGLSAKKTKQPKILTTSHTGCNGKRHLNGSRLDRSALSTKPTVQKQTTRETDGDSNGKLGSSRKRLLSDRITGEGPKREESSSAEAPLVPGYPYSFPKVGYNDTRTEDIPFRSKVLGGELNPFHTWPPFANEHLDVTDLKWKCSMRFASKAMALIWIPSLLQARHAFLSTLCISTAHDDIMARALMPAPERSRRPSFERMQVRQEVIGMISESMNDPELRTADATIIAVLHVLNSEIMGCNDEMMRIHQQGLHSMIWQRGGLQRLGVKGNLASITTVTMYIIAVLRETRPARDFVTFAWSQQTSITDDAVRIPESPVCCKPSGFSSISRALKPNSETDILLNTVRILTNKFFHENAQQAMTRQTPFRIAKFWDQSTDSIINLRDQIFALPPADRVDSFADMDERYRYESVRLVSLVYSHAIAMNLPFSRAAEQLQQQESISTTSLSDVNLNATPCDDHVIPLPIRIRDAMLRTNTSVCWGHLAGVLFWATLVAGAAANPGPLTTEDRVSEDEDARKWLAAVSIRCSIVLAFEHPGPIMETLKRLAAIEAVLSKGYEGGSEYGPTEPVLSFVDFAQEFQIV